MEHSGDKEDKREDKTDKSKIFVKSDESWKAEAQKEKERLQEKTDADRSAHDLPPPSFMGFLGGLGVQAMVALGLLSLAYDPIARTSVTATIFLLVMVGFCIYGPQVLLVGTAPADLARRGT